MTTTKVITLADQGYPTIIVKLIESTTHGFWYTVWRYTGNSMPVLLRKERTATRTPIKDILSMLRGVPPVIA